MTVTEAQREVRTIYRGGAVGQVVSGAIWLVSSALSTWAGIAPGIIGLVVGGMFIFPLTQLVLRLAGRPYSLSPANPMRQLAMQVAFIVPLTLPVAGGAALYNVNWFYPACMVLVGAHYLPFIFLYGMWQFGALAAAMLGGGFWLALRMPHEFVAGGWATGALLVLFGVLTTKFAHLGEVKGADAP
jgi:hypothetical protein